MSRKGYRAVVYVRIEADLDDHTTEFDMADRFTARIADSVELLSRNGTVQATNVTAQTPQDREHRAIVKGLTYGG